MTPQSALQAEARVVLAELDLATLAADIGPPLMAGSFVSGLMCWRELDVMVLACPTHSSTRPARRAARAGIAIIRKA